MATTRIYMWGILTALGIMGALAFATFPSLAFAQADVVQKLSAIEEKGLVPCGGTGRGQTSCKICDIFVLAKNITDFMVYAGFLVATLSIAIGGFMLMIGGFSESQVSKGKEILTAGIVGLLIILFAWFIVDTTIKVLVGDVTIFDVTSTGAGNFEGLGPWNDIKCQEIK